jgi:Spy/CpxP family protein refolding chaperone
MKIGAITLVTFAVTLFAASAQAQDAGGMSGMGGGFGGRHHKQGQTKTTDTPKPKADEKAYTAALKDLPDKKYDAWHGVR